MSNEDELWKQFEEDPRFNPIFSLNPPAWVAHLLAPYLKVRRRLVRCRAIKHAKAWKSQECPDCRREVNHCCYTVWRTIVDEFESILLEQEPELKDVHIELSYEYLSVCPRRRRDLQ